MPSPPPINRMAGSEESRPSVLLRDFLGGKGLEKMGRIGRPKAGGLRGTRWAQRWISGEIVKVAFTMLYDLLVDEPVLLCQILAELCGAISNRLVRGEQTV